MVNIEDKHNYKEVFSTENKYIHRINSECYFKRASVLDGEKEDDFEEVEELPIINEEIIVD